MSLVAKEGNWRWLTRYTLAILLAMALGGALGELALFKQTTLATPRLTASTVVQFFGFGGALAMFWLMGQRASDYLRRIGGKVAPLGHIVLPFVTLVTLAVGYQIALNILRPFLESSARNNYNWAFVIAITASALWLMVALFRHSEPLLANLDRHAGDVPQGTARCAACGVTTDKEDRYCRSCGASVPDLT